MIEYGLIAIAFADDTPCPHSGQWLRYFDHEAYDGQGFGEFTEDPALAARFASSGHAMEFWAKQSVVKPLRPDGRPNKPLTALTVSIEPLP